MQNFIDIKDLSSTEIKAMLALALDVKKNPSAYAKKAEGKILGLLFEKPSMRTRVSFEVGMKQLGGGTVVLQDSEVGLGKREAIEDAARVLSRYLSVMMIRTFSHQEFIKFTQYSTVPVINGLTDSSHPCQALADALTILEVFGSLEGRKITYIGDGNNVCVSLIEIAEKTGMTITVSCPEGHEPQTQSPFILERDPQKASKGAEVIYTDVWTSMGQESENEQRLKIFKAYQVNTEIMALADPKAIFLHCLPAHRGQEVTHDVMESAASYVFDQAENRMHAQKAILLRCLQA